MKCSHFNREPHDHEVEKFAKMDIVCQIRFKFVKLLKCIALNNVKLLSLEVALK